MMIFMRRLFLAAVAAGAITLSAQPVVNDGGILNAASYANSRLPGGGIAQGSIFVVFGRNLGPAAIAQAGFPIPNTLSGTSIRVTSGGQTVDCPIIYTLAGQVAAILPSTTPVSGTASLVLTYNGQASAPRTFRVVANSFGTFAANSAGSGPGVITNFVSQTSQPVNTIFRSAMPGQTLILYGTGLGPLPAGTPDNAAAPVVAINQANVEVFVGNNRVTPAYAGRAPGFAGLDQINFVVPSGVTGCAVPVMIKIGNLVSNATTIAVSANGGTCSDPLGLTQSQLDQLNSTGRLRLGTIGLARTSVEISILGFTAAVTSDGGTATFFEYTPQTAAVSGSLNAGGSTSIGTCTVYTGTSSNLVPDDPIQPRGLNAGALINVNGPRGAKTMTPPAPPAPPEPGIYFGTFATGGVSIPGAPPADPPYLEPGAYTFNNGSGGADVGAFTANFNLTNQITWTNRAAITNVNRANGLTVTWSGGTADGIVQITGYSSSDASENSILGIFVCTEVASRGTFTVPSVVLLSLPATPTGAGLGLPLGVLAVGGTSPPRTFTAPGLDAGYIFSTSLSGKSVNYQ
jgi:uncharacterized protein (TIGR03437 family)